MTETVQGNTIRAEEISYDFSTHTWEIVYSDNESDRKLFHVRRIPETATLQEVFNILIQELKK